MSNRKPNTNVYYSKCKVRPKILNTKRRNKSRLTLRNCRWTFFCNNIRCISVYTGVHVTCFVFLTIPGAKSQVQITLLGWPQCIGDRLICKTINVFPLSHSQLSDLSWLGWKLNLSGQFCDNRVNRLKMWTREMSQKNSQETTQWGTLCIHLLHYISHVCLKAQHVVLGCHFFGFCEKRGNFHDR